MIIDTHAHLDMPQFEADRDEVIARAREAGVEMIFTIASAAPDGSSVRRSLALCDTYDQIYAGIGVHPHDARLIGEGDWERLEAQAAHPKVVVWGEIGLDYYYDHSPREVQKAVFRRQLEIARRRGLPVAIHCRDAWTDLIAIIREEWPEGPCRGIMHSFTGTRDQALLLAGMGFHISFSGMVTFKNASSLRDAAAALPPACLLVETDSPYLAPVPHRGKRNEPAFAVDVARGLARICGINFEQLAALTTRSAKSLTGLPT